VFFSPELLFYGWKSLKILKELFNSVIRKPLLKNIHAAQGVINGESSYGDVR
jgi:hypothetical protein